MQDIVPELYNKILKDFNTSVKRSGDIRDFNKKLKDETATGEDVSKYASDLGELASAALLLNITEEALPDGKMYWNIAERTVKPLLVLVYDMVNEAAFAVQELEDKKLGIGLNPVKAPFPEERVKALLDQIVLSTEEVNA